MLFLGQEPNWLLLDSDYFFHMFHTSEMHRWNKNGPDMSENYEVNAATRKFNICKEFTVLTLSLLWMIQPSTNQAMETQWGHPRVSGVHTCLCVYVCVVRRGKELDKTLISNTSNYNNFCRTQIRWISPPLSEHMHTTINFLVHFPTRSCSLWHLLSHLLICMQTKLIKCVFIDSE